MLLDIIIIEIQTVADENMALVFYVPSM